MSESEAKPLIGVYEGECPNEHAIRTTTDHAQWNSELEAWVRCSTCGEIGIAERVDVAKKGLVSG